MGSIAKAQDTAMIYGTIKDESGAAIGMADVWIDGTDHAAFTDEDGLFELTVEIGEQLMGVSAFGYNEQSHPILLTANQKLELSIVLTQEEMTTQLGEATISRTVNRENEAALLNLQKQSVSITENIGLKELERKGVSDVASALTKVSGISKQEGSSVVYVRGLGDRYNSTTLNGLPIPSNDPEYKNIDLSLFTTDILSYIDIEKVYNSTFFGDFAGGNVNISSKSQTGKGFFQLGMKKSMNTNAVSHDNFRLQQGFDWLGFSKTKNPNTLNSYAFENSLNPKKSKYLGSGFSIATGEKFKLGDQSQFSFFLTASHDNDYNSIEEGYLKSGINMQGTVQGKDFERYEAFNYQTNTTGFLNLSLKIDPKNKINFNSLFINSSHQKLEEGQGYMRDNANEGGFLRRGTFVQNQLWINQLLGKHDFNERVQLNWGVALNTINSDMPDRFQNIVEWKSALNSYVLANSSASLNHRYFQVLDENEIVGNVNMTFKFAENEDNKYKGKLTVGYNGRFKQRDFEAMQYNLSPYQAMQIVDFNNLDAFYNADNYAAGAFQLSTFSGQSLAPQFYKAEQNIHGGFANIEYQFSPKFTAVLGLRAENVEQTVEWNTSLDPQGDQNKLSEVQFLPSLNLKYAINNDQNLRLGASKTYTLPQFKERALFMYEELGETVYGWPTTYASDDYNLDLKWEIFPHAGELISLTGFGKYILNPINKFTVASSTDDISFTNTGDWGYVLGGEIALRKSIYRSASENPVQFTVGANASYAYTQQELNSEKIFNETLLNSGSRLNANFTNDRDRFQGASDWLINGDISFSKDWQNDKNLLMTVAYQYFSDRIYALGTDGRGNIVEKGLGSLDFILRTKLNAHLGFNFQAKNLLNPSFERTQENATQNITVLHYKKGAQFSLGVNYQF